MLTAISGIITLLSSGAGGGILGGFFGLFKQSQERKERIEMEKIQVERDRIDAEDRKLEREHQLTMLERGAELQIEQAQTEAEAEMEVANQAALQTAQKAEFSKLSTTSGMDNYRASVRPTLAYWAATLFSLALGYAFYRWNAKIDPETGKEILLGLFGTLSFTVTSIVTFYYVSRRNGQQR